MTTQTQTPTPTIAELIEILAAVTDRDTTPRVQLSRDRRSVIVGYSADGYVRVAPDAEMPGFVEVTHSHSLRRSGGRVADVSRVLRAAGLRHLSAVRER